MEDGALSGSAKELMYSLSLPVCYSFACLECCKNALCI